jgi:hypothetical protein
MYFQLCLKQQNKILKIDSKDTYERIDNKIIVVFKWLQIWLDLKAKTLFSIKLNQILLKKYVGILKF